MAKIVDEKNDGWQNELTGLNMYARDKRARAVIMAPTTLTQSEKEDLYSGDDIARTIIELPAEEMARGGGLFKAEDADKAGEIAKKIASLDIIDLFKEAQIWANIHGGSAILLGVPGDYSEPLEDDDPRGLRFTVLLDKDELQVETWYEDPGENYGKPETYRLTPINGGTDTTDGKAIHESRLLVFEGLNVTRRRRRILNGWGESVLTPIVGIIRDFDQAWAGLSALLADFSQAVFKMKGLEYALSQDGQQIIKSRMEVMDMARSMIRAIVIDGDGEDFERKVTPLTGLPESLVAFEARVAYAARIPATKLFGKSPDGMNATGEGDSRNWYDRINMLRKTRWDKHINKVLTLLMSSSGGELEGWEWTWAPLWEPSEKERAETRLVTAQRDQIEWTMGAVSSDEVRESRHGGEGWSMDTHLQDTSELEEITEILERPGVTEPQEAPQGEQQTQPGKAPAVDTKVALNGAQVTAMVDVMKQVASRELPRDTAIKLMAIAFNLEESEVDRLMGTVGVSFFNEIEPQEPSRGEQEE